MNLSTPLNSFTTETVGDLIEFLKEQHFVQGFASEEDAAANPQVADIVLGDQVVFCKNVKFKDEISIPNLKVDGHKVIMSVDEDTLVVGALQTI